MSVLDEILCYDDDAVPLCPPKADYDDLYYCCIKNGIASCCTEEEKLGEIVGIRMPMVFGLVVLAFVLILIMGILIWLCCRKQKLPRMPVIDMGKLGSDEEMYSHTVLPALFYEGTNKVVGPGHGENVANQEAHL